MKSIKSDIGIQLILRLKNILYDGNTNNYKIKLAQKILYSNPKSNIQNNLNQAKNNNLNNLEKIGQILNKMRILLKNNN